MVRLAEIYECSVAMYAWKYMPHRRPARPAYVSTGKYMDHLQMSPDLRRIWVAGGEIHGSGGFKAEPLSFESAGRQRLQQMAAAAGPQLTTRRCRISIAHTAEGKHTPLTITSSSVASAMAARASGAPSPGHARGRMPGLFGTSRTVERGLRASRTAVHMVSDINVLPLVPMRSCVHALSSSVAQDAVHRRSPAKLPRQGPSATEPATPLQVP